MWKLDWETHQRNRVGDNPSQHITTTVGQDSLDMTKFTLPEFLNHCEETWQRAVLVWVISPSVRFVGVLWATQWKHLVTFRRCAITCSNKIIQGNSLLMLLSSCSHCSNHTPSALPLQCPWTCSSLCPLPTCPHVLSTSFGSLLKYPFNRERFPDLLWETVTATCSGRNGGLPKDICAFKCPEPPYLGKGPLWKWLS